MSEELGKSQNALDQSDERAVEESHENDDELHAWCTLEETEAESANRTRANEESSSHHTAERSKQSESELQEKSLMSKTVGRAAE